MTEASILATPGFMIPFTVLSKKKKMIPFTVETDASGTTMGAVLIQQSHHLAYYSKVFCPRLQRASTYVWELHAITSVVWKWR